MDITPTTLIGAPAGRERCIVRGERLVRVKFVGLPIQAAPEAAFKQARASGFWGYLSRVIDRLVAARP